MDTVPYWAPIAFALKTIVYMAGIVGVVFILLIIFDHARTSTIERYRRKREERNG